MATLHEKAWEGVNQGAFLYYRPKEKDIIDDISYSFCGLVEEILIKREAYYPDGGVRALEIFDKSNVLPLKYTEIALRAILGGALVAAATLLVPIGYAFELIHYCYNNYQDAKRFMNEPNFIDGI